MHQFEGENWFKEPSVRNPLARSLLQSMSDEIPAASSDIGRGTCLSLSFMLTKRIAGLICSTVRMRIRFLVKAKILPKRSSVSSNAANPVSPGAGGQFSYLYPVQ